MVTLVLNLTTTRVSPQFHVAHDHFFDTVEQGNKDVQKWKQLAGFNTIKYTTISLHDVTNHLLQRLSPAAPIREPEGVMLTVTDHNVTPKSATNLVDNDSPVEPVALRRSSRVRRPTRRLLESQDARQSFSSGSFRSQTIAFFAYYECLHQEDYRIQDELKHSLCYQVDKDVLHYGHTTKTKDKSHFQRAMRKEFTDHEVRKHWKIIPIEDVLDSVWVFKRKREILTGQIYKYKARLNMHGGQQTYGDNFFETYSPVVSRTIYRILLLHTIVHRWHARQVDLVLAYP